MPSCAPVRHDRLVRTIASILKRANRHPRTEITMGQIVPLCSNADKAHHAPLPTNVISHRADIAAQGEKGGVDFIDVSVTTILPAPDNKGLHYTSFRIRHQQKMSRHKHVLPFLPPGSRVVPLLFATTGEVERESKEYIERALAARPALRPGDYATEHKVAFNRIAATLANSFGALLNVGDSAKDEVDSTSSSDGIPAHA